MDVAIGVDSHKESLAAAAVDGLGAVIAAEQFRNDPGGHDALLKWARDHGESGSRRIGIECSGSYGAGLAKALVMAQEQVSEVPSSLAVRERRRSRSRGKSDLVDAVAIARVVSRGEGLSSTIRVQAFADLKLLCDHRVQLIHARTRTANRAHIELVIACPGYQQRVPNLRAECHQAAARRLLRGDHSVRAELIRWQLAELARLHAEVAKVDKLIKEKVKATGTSLLDIPGVGPFIAAKILGEVGDVSRLRSKAAFALMSGTAPLQASSGATTRHRLNRGGNRQLNWALHFIALVQSRTLPEAKAYLIRQKEAGKSHKEAMRSLKRHLSNVVYRHLVSDLKHAQVAT